MHGAVDALLDARRPLAALVALGVDAAVLERVHARQLAAVALPAILLGVVAGGAVGAVFAVLVEDVAGVAVVLLSTALAALVAALAVLGAARLAARLLRPRLRDALQPDALRTA